MKAMRKGNGKGTEESSYDYYDTQNITSQTDCTGMIPAPPLDDAQLDGYHDIFSIQQQKSTGALKKEDAAEQKRKSSRPRV